MKIKYALFLVLVLSCYSYAQNTSLFDSYKIPRISFQALDLYGNDLLNLHNVSYNDDGSEENSFSMNLNLSHKMILQSPMFSNRITTYMRLNYNKTTTSGSVFPSRLDETINGSIRVTSLNNWYLDNEKGMFLFFDPDVYIYNNRNTIKKNDSKQSLFSTSFGVGYGRVINVRYVVQAYIIADELECSLSDEKLHQLAELIEKREEGEYSAKYKEDHEINFYKDVASITGKPEYESKIRQILYSNLYQTSMRETGWLVKLGTRYTYNERNDFYANPVFPNAHNEIINGADLFSSFSYSLPIGFNKQFSASAEYSLNLDDGRSRMPKLLLSADFSIDHNYLWSSQLSVFYNTAFAIGEENMNNYGALIRTDLVLLNRLSVNAAVQYSNTRFFSTWQYDWNPLTERCDKQKNFGFSIGFNYHIF